MKVAIIGDIHGCHQKLLELLEKLPADIEQIYSTGDLIDRGPDSDKVVQECIDRNIICVKGNHEDMFIDYITGEGEYDKGIFEMNGGIATLEAYANENKEIDIPDEHIEFLVNMPYYIETDDFILTHGGISTSIRDTFRDCSEQSKRLVMWNRGGICGSLGKVQVHGHTPKHNVHFIKRGGEVDGINVDTGGVFGYKLSAVILPTMEVVEVKVPEQKVVVPSIYQ